MADHAGQLRWHRLVQERDALRAERDALVAALRDYGRHLPDCSQRHPLNRQGMPPYPCTCGLNKRLAAHGG